MEQLNQVPSPTTTKFKSASVNTTNKRMVANFYVCGPNISLVLGITYKIIAFKTHLIK
jgi:hypothetical protein